MASLTFSKDTLKELTNVGYEPTRAGLTISIVIPSTVNLFFGTKKYISAAPCDVLAHIKEQTERTFAELFGGYSLTLNSGGWLDMDTEELVREDCAVISSDIMDLSANAANEVIRLAREIRHTLNQDAVMIKINSQPIFIR